MKIKNFMKYFKEGVLKYFKISTNFFKYFKVKYFIVHPYLSRTLSSTKYYTAYYRVTDIIINTIISSGLFWQKKEHQTKRRCK